MKFQSDVKLSLNCRRRERAARQRYSAVADALKREAGIEKHYKHKSMSGLAWIGTGKILAPEGVTRRQLYVLAHECGHIILHRLPSTWAKPSHVKEHEAETYAHRAFRRYDIEIPEKSALWARAYVAQWIRKDQSAGIPICPDALAFADGSRSPYAPLASVDGHPKDDFSKRLDQHLARGLRTIEKQDSANGFDTKPTSNAEPAIQHREPPNACGTCIYFTKSTIDHLRTCDAYTTLAGAARFSAHLCNDGKGWRADPAEIFKLNPRPVQPTRPSVFVSQPSATTPLKDLPRKRRFWARLGDAIIDRVAGVHWFDTEQGRKYFWMHVDDKGNLVSVEEHTQNHNSR